jgi:hypothetical protein
MIVSNVVRKSTGRVRMDPPRLSDPFAGGDARVRLFTCEANVQLIDWRMFGRDPVPKVAPGPAASPVVLMSFRPETPERRSRGEWRGRFLNVHRGVPATPNAPVADRRVFSSGRFMRDAGFGWRCGGTFGPTAAVRGGAPS